MSPKNRVSYIFQVRHIAISVRCILYLYIIGRYKSLEQKNKTKSLRVFSALTSGFAQISIGRDQFTLGTTAKTYLK